jgi:hypothetical protein
MSTQADKKKIMIASCCCMIGRLPIRGVWAGAKGAAEAARVARGMGAMARWSVDFVFY